MIEVEKKFRPTDEQLNALLKDSEFIKEITNHDVIYDYPDYRLIKKGIRLRDRNGSFELKISEGEEDGSEGHSSMEIENDAEIQKYFNTDLPVGDFVKENLIEGINIKTNRKKYKKDEFVIDIDDLDFGYKCVEIELMVNDKSGIPEAYNKILELAKKYNFELKDVPAKKKEYFRIVKPEVYKLLYS